MNTINRKPLFLAIAGMSALGAVGTAYAAEVNPTGMGSALIYPYYTVKSTAGGPFNTLLSIVNTTASTKAVKIRFREGKASVEVLDFNIFLSPNDVWTGEIAPSLDGGAKIVTADRSCTIPTVFGAQATNTAGEDGVEFRNDLYIGDAVGDNSLTRLKEGYFEVFEMATYADNSSTAINSKHRTSGVNKGIPFDCSAVTTALAAAEALDIGGGLSGTVSVVQPGAGLNVAADAVAIEKWRITSIYRDTNSNEPNILNADPWSVTPTGDGNAVWASWGVGALKGANAISAALMKNTLINEYVLDAATNSKTDWVVTFPTKNAYVSSAVVLPPFQSKLGTKGSCDDIAIDFWNREEQTPGPQCDPLLDNECIDFSPPRTSSSPLPQLCWEANIVSFNGKNVFGSSNRLDFFGPSLQTPPFENGWARLTFHPLADIPLVATTAWLITQSAGGAAPIPPTVLPLANRSFTGLPAIGYAVQTFNPISTSSYAGTFVHRFEPGTPDPLTIQTILLQ